MSTLCLLLALTAGTGSAFAGTIPVGSNGSIFNDTLHHLDQSSTDRDINITISNFTQRLDHFNLFNRDTFQQRYYAKEEFWKANGPVFIFIGGEGPLKLKRLSQGLLRELTLENNGALFALEHRYYGVSMPPEWEHNLKYLSSRQALADLAEFIRQLKRDPKYNRSKVVVIGGSYAGNLAAWMRAKYPDLVDAALASSAPLLAKMGFAEEYLSLVYNVYKKYGGDECINHIEIFMQKLTTLLSSKIYWPTKMRKLMGEYKCKREKEITSDKLISRFMGVFTHSVQYGHPQTIRDYCNAISLVESENILKSFDKVVSLMADDFPGKFCKVLEGSKLWIYQECTEFGYYASDQRCKKVIINQNEISVAKAVRKTNAYYGGLKLNVSRVVFTHGDMDPWARLGLTREQSSPQAPVIIIQGASHCKDLTKVTANDSEDLINSRKVIKYYIKTWIQNNKN